MFIQDQMCEVYREDWLAAAMYEMVRSHAVQSNKVGLQLRLKLIPIGQPVPLCTDEHIEVAYAFLL